MTHWRPSGRARERIMAFGGIGSGKTLGAAQIARKALGPDDTLWIVDRDNSWDRILDSDIGDELGVREEWRDGTRDTTMEVEDGRIVVFHVTNWDSIVEALGSIWSRAGRDDWIVVDDMTWLWQDIQNWYYMRTFGEEMPDFLLQHRKNQLLEGKVTAKEGATQGQDAQLIEWNYLNPLWNRTIATPFVNPPCHLYVCAASKEIRTDGRVKSEVMDTYGTLGYSPSTQWRLGGQMQTVLFLDKTKKAGVEKYRMTSVKDRQRELLDREEWSDMFAYLRRVGGWRVAK